MPIVENLNALLALATNCEGFARLGRAQLLDCRQLLSNPGAGLFGVRFWDYFTLRIARELGNARRFSGGNPITQGSEAAFTKGLWSIFAALWFPN